jgi:hypothetical protein
VVLVRAYRLLVPCRAAKRQPGPGGRRIAEVRYPQLKEAPGHRVDDERDDSADVHRVGARIHQ